MILGMHVKTKQSRWFYEVDLLIASREIHTSEGFETGPRDRLPEKGGLIEVDYEIGRFSAVRFRTI